MDAKTVFIVGGSGGLGKSIARSLASRGAHVTIFARREAPLAAAKADIETAALSAAQEISAVQIEEAFRSQPRMADALYCAAGGNHAENGFLVDMTAAQLASCMHNNYFTSLYPAKSILGIWTEDDAKKDAAPPAAASPRRRQIILVSSAAAFAALPGSVAYNPAKSAVRALADTLRLELMRYSCTASAYSVHCAFPGDFLSPGFWLEQETKTPLTKRIQGTDRPLEQLAATCPSSDRVAELMIRAAENGDYIICKDSAAASLLFTSMTGPSPKRGMGLADSLLGLLVGWIVWPVLRRRWEWMCAEDGERAREARRCKTRSR
ncbi:putative secondary metabolism biosynthetic enzyme [Claviceps citrina]|nr:putative secondary metabolism biosynthetic enzyme [Claviceps citrina]